MAAIPYNDGPSHVSVRVNEQPAGPTKIVLLDPASLPLKERMNQQRALLTGYHFEQARYSYSQGASTALVFDWVGAPATASSIAGFPPELIIACWNLAAKDVSYGVPFPKPPKTNETLTGAIALYVLSPGSGALSLEADFTKVWEPQLKVGAS